LREIASKGQLRASFARWAIVTVPLILLLGFGAGSLAPSGEDNPWFVALTKPALMPPGWAFPVAWTTLYIMLGLALAVILHARGAPGRGLALGLFIVQMALNLVWAPMFFGAHLVSAALLVIVAMLAAALATTFAFARIRKAAAWLMVPYLAWLCFATGLNWRIDQLNPDAESLVPSRTSTQIQL
jgi:translocator protein